ncbi:hypothetical protein [Azospirillum doebereinerae]
MPARAGCARAELGVVPPLVLTRFDPPTPTGGDPGSGTTEPSAGLNGTETSTRTS